MLPRNLRQPRATQHAGNFLATLPVVEAPHQGARAPARFSLLDQVMMVGKGGDLWQVGNANHLMGPRQCQQFPAYRLRGASSNAGIDFIEYEGALHGGRRRPPHTLPGFHTRL